MSKIVTLIMAVAAYVKTHKTETLNAGMIPLYRTASLLQYTEKRKSVPLKVFLRIPSYDN